MVLYGFNDRQLRYELKVYQFTVNPDFYYQKWAGETPLLMAVPFLVSWQGTLDKTDDRACAISTALWGLLHLRDENLLPEVEAAIGQSVGHILEAAKTLPSDISGKLFRLSQGGIKSRALYSYSTQSVTNNLRETPIAPALEVLKK